MMYPYRSEAIPDVLKILQQRRGERIHETVDSSLGFELQGTFKISTSGIEQYTLHRLQ